MKPEFKFGRRCADNTSPDAPTQVPNYRPVTQRTRIHEPRTYKPDRPEYDPNRTRPRVPVTPRPTQSYRTSSRAPNYPNRDENRTPYYPPSPPVREEEPDKCKTTFNAVAFIRNELMIFKDRWLWRFHNTSGTLKPVGERASVISGMFRGLNNLDHIDAVFEMKNGQIAFFEGRKIYIFNQQISLVGVSDLKHFGFDHRLKKVDAIFRWNYNKNIYVFSGGYYWK